MSTVVCMCSVDCQSALSSTSHAETKPRVCLFSLNERAGQWIALSFCPRHHGGKTWLFMDKTVLPLLCFLFQLRGVSFTLQMLHRATNLIARSFLVVENVINHCMVALRYFYHRDEFPCYTSTDVSDCCLLYKFASIRSANRDD